MRGCPVGTAKEHRAPGDSDAPLAHSTLGQLAHLAGDLQCLSLVFPCPVYFSELNYSSGTNGCWTVIREFGKNLMSVLSVLSTILGSGCTAVKKMDKISCPLEAYIML